jgi:hypothetical protein
MFLFHQNGASMASGGQTNCHKVSRTSRNVSRMRDAFTCVTYENARMYILLIPITRGDETIIQPSFSAHLSRSAQVLLLKTRPKQRRKESITRYLLVVIYHLN